MKIEKNKLRPHAVLATSAPCTNTRPTAAPVAFAGGGRMRGVDRAQGMSARRRIQKEIIEEAPGLK
jgi:hypothetical protein